MGLDLSEIREKLACCMQNVNSTVGLQEKGSLREIGLDSMEIVNFFLEVESAFCVEIPQESIDENNLYDINNLLAYLSELS